MAFVHNHNQFPVSDATLNLNLVVQEVPGVATVKSRLAPQLFQQAVVEVPGCELGIRKGVI